MASDIQAYIADLEHQTEQAAAFFEEWRERLTALKIAYRIRIGEAYEDGLRDGANIAEPVKADRDALANELKTVREVLATVRNRLAGPEPHSAVALIALIDAVLGESRGP